MYRMVVTYPEFVGSDPVFSYILLMLLTQTAVQQKKNKIPVNTNSLLDLIQTNDVAAIDFEDGCSRKDTKHMNI